MQQRLSLTFVSPRFLFPTDSGGKIRTTQVLRGMKGGRFDITLAMPSDRAGERKHAREIESVCDRFVGWPHDSSNGFVRLMRRVLLLASSQPMPVAVDFSRTGAAAVGRLLDDEPDVVVFDFPHSVVLARRLGPSPSVLFTHNIEAEIFSRHAEVATNPFLKWVWRDQYRKMRKYERSTLKQFDAIVAVSERDAEFFRSAYDIENCRTIPTGVDSDHFSYVAPSGAAQVAFCGSMDWLANIDAIEFFFDEVWPSVRQRVPAARMRVVGRSPPASLVKRIRGAAPEWEFTGFVDDVRTYVPGADVFVIPLRVGGGTRIKAFEAMAMGSPVVSTAIGVEGLPVKPGVHYLLGDTPDEISAHVVTLLTDAEARMRISLAARAFIHEQFGFRAAARAFEDICLDTLERRRVDPQA